MTSPSTEELLEFALELASAADASTMRQFRAEPETWQKADGSLATVADTQTESLLRGRIRDRFPDHRVLGEEEGLSVPSMPMDPASGRQPLSWVLDPIDGTHNYVRGIPIWASLIACERNGRPEVGVVSAPALGTRWWAARGLGAYRGTTRHNDPSERIFVSQRALLSEAQVLYGSYRLTLDAWGGRAETLMRGAWRQRGFGDFWQHCLVAEGAAEVALEAEIKHWDIAAVQVIVEEAGGRLTDIDGTPSLDAGHCITSNGRLHDEVLRVLRGD